MHVVVAIVGFRNANDISACLRALTESTYKDFEVVICENGGRKYFEYLKDNLPDTLGEGRKVHIILAEGNLGYAGGVNACIAARPHADAWWILNPDTLPAPDTMARYVARLRDGDCDAVGSTICFADGRIQSHGGRWRPWLARAESIGSGGDRTTVPRREDVEREQNYLNGASMMVSRRFVREVGLMREEYFLYCEEVEWCLRALRSGMRLGFAPNAFVIHHGGATTGSSAHVRQRPRMPIYLDERNKMLVTRDRFNARLPVAAVAALLLLILRFTRRGAWRQTGYALAGWSDGLKNRRGKPIWITD